MNDYLTFTNGIEKCPFISGTKPSSENLLPLSSKSHDDIKLSWVPESKPIKLRNYQTGETVDVAGPTTNVYNDCRHHVCTSTFMSLAAHSNQNQISKEKTINELESTDPYYILKEAHDFLTIYHKDMKTSKTDYEKRLQEINHEIEQTGIYTHTTDELEYGCQLAWRNASRCVNRLFWRTLKAIDRRNITTNDEMFKAICDHIRFAYNGGTLQASVLVMNPKARLWSTQYFRYACYEQSDGSLLGDPANQELTKVAMELGWNKTEEERTPWDLLPIIVQVESNEIPTWYELPEDLRFQVYLSHSDLKYDTVIKSLGLRWFAQPYVSDKAIEVGGVFYRCVPFSGWFMQTEVGRNLCDVQRYNYIPKLAALLDLDITPAGNSQLNIDRIYIEINAAVLYSFEKAKIAIVDHHTAAAGFMKFMKAEIKQRGNTPADWIWLVPPISGGMSSLFHQEMLNYVVKPRILDQREPWTTYTPLKKHKDIGISSNNRIRRRWLILQAARVIIGLALAAMKQRISVNVLYASCNGTAYSYALQMRQRLLHIGYNPIIMELDSFSFIPKKRIRSISFIITSTFGQGNAPDGGTKVEEWLKNDSESFSNNINCANSFDDIPMRCRIGSFPESSSNIHIKNRRSKTVLEPPTDNFNKNHRNLNVSKNNNLELGMRSLLMWCSYAVCAIGSSAYPFYCGFGKSLDKTLEKLGGRRLIPLAMCDALNQQFKKYNDWENTVIKTLRSAYPHACLRPESHSIHSINSNSSIERRRSMVEQEISFNTSIRPVHVSLEFYPNKKKNINQLEQIRPFTKDNPFNATVLQNIELIGSQNIIDNFSVNQKELNTSSNFSTSNTVNIDEEHSVRLIVFDTTGLSYNPGDHICILPENTLINVTNFLLACGWESNDERLDQPCSLSSFTNGKYDTIREILTYFVDLNTTPQAYLLSIIATYATDSHEQRNIMELSNGTQRYEDWKINAPTVKEMLNQFPSIKIPIDEIIQLLPKLQPRYYSISSSMRCNPNQLHITVSVVTYTTQRGIIRKGVCSNFLQHTTPLLSEEGNIIHSSTNNKTSNVRLFIVPNPYFRLPGQENLLEYITNDKESLIPLNSSILMFAVGSGIAPFRSFWQELQMLQRVKEYNGNKIDRVLFMGCRTPNDFLYAKELQSLSSEEDINGKILTSIIPVYSRENSAAKRYVQDAMLDYEHLIYPIITQKNTFIYMCGSVHACQGIESVLISILHTSSNGDITSDEANNQIQQLKQNGKIRQDMFG